MPERGGARERGQFYNRVELTLLAFLLQRYWVSRRSYMSVSGKPTVGRIQYGSPWARVLLTAPCILMAAFVALIYVALFLGALTRVWGADWTLTTEHFVSGVLRGLGSIRDTTLLSVIATPITGLLGMLIAILVVRRRVPGQGFIDFSSKLGGAVPGTVESVDGTRARVRTLGQVLPAHVREDARPSPGAEVAVVVRPEGLTIRGATAGKSQGIEGQVVRAVYLGAVAEYDVHVNGATLAVTVHGPSARATCTRSGSASSSTCCLTRSTCCREAERND